MPAHPVSSGISGRKLAENGAAVVKESGYLLNMAAVRANRTDMLFWRTAAALEESKYHGNRMAALAEAFS